MSKGRNTGFRPVAMLAAVLTVLAAPCLSVAAAEEERWTVARAEGAVEVAAEKGDWRIVQPGAVLSPGSRVATGADGRLTLVRGNDSISAGPATEFEISNVGADQPHSILQSLGRMLFRMESRETRDFSVGTPYLAAAIKGTTFTVGVMGDGADVTVDEGLVAVTVVATGEVIIVERGGHVGVSGGSGAKRADVRNEPSGRPDVGGRNASIPESPPTGERIPNLGSVAAPETAGDDDAPGSARGRNRQP